MLYDGIQQIVGVSGQHPNLIPEGFCAGAVNRDFRYGNNKARLPIKLVRLSFPNDTDGDVKKLFEGGNLQGATVWESYPSFLKSKIVVSIAGTIFYITIIGNTGQVYKLIDGNDPVLTHAWFGQGFEWLFMQNGLQQPIVWNGIDPSEGGIVRRTNVGNINSVDAQGNYTDPPEMPIGSVMAFIHGRMAVASADGTNQIALGDIVYGQRATTTADIISFTESQYWAEGGAFGAPIYVGDIMGMIGMPYLDTGTGQNELVVLGTEGAISLNLSIPREEWINSSVLRVSLIGAGCASTHSLCALNGDLLYRGYEGIRSYKNSRMEFQDRWNQAPISLDVRRWTNYDRRDLLEYNSQVTWENRLISTVRPALAAPNNPLAGFHRFHRGMVVMDAEPQSTSDREGAPIWNGLWTGIRPTAMVEGRFDDRHRCFAFSYDRDGYNRLYEICDSNGDDEFGTQKRKKVSYFDTRNLGKAGDQSTNFMPKTMKNGEIELSGLQSAVQVSASFRPDSSPCFVDLASWTAYCDCAPAQPCLQASQAAFQRRLFSGFDDKCIPGTNQKLKSIRHWQGRITLTGEAEVERLVYGFDNDNDRQTTVNCDSDRSCRATLCCPLEQEFAYHIAPEGTNPNVPFIPTPSDVGPSWVSNQTATAVCPPGSTGRPVTVTASYTSMISQADADSHASQLALQQATAGLQCTGCNPATLITFKVKDGTVDLSAFFAAGFFGPTESRQWRLIDLESETIYGSGLVGEDGTLGVAYALQTGNDTFDPVTFIFTDSSGTVAPVGLQVACNSNTGPVFPPIENPY